MFNILFVILGLVSLVALYGMYRVCDAIHDSLRAFFTKHATADKVIEGKLHVTAFGVAIFVAAASLAVISSPWLYSSLPVLKLAAGLLYIVYIFVGLKHLVPKRIFENNNDTTKGPDSK